MAPQSGDLWHIILPLCTPHCCAGIFTFQRYWNGFILPLVVLRDSFKYPIQVGLATLQGEFNTDYGMLMTGAAVAAIPMMLVFSPSSATSSKASASAASKARSHRSAASIKKGPPNRDPEKSGRRDSNSRPSPWAPARALLLRSFAERRS